MSVDVFRWFLSISSSFLPYKLAKKEREENQELGKSSSATTSQMGT
jgi:hypothetical protein